MKAATLRTFQALHTWTGLIAGFALFVAFYAGALTVFHDDIAAWQNPPWRSTVDAGVSADALINALLSQHPHARDDFGIVLPADSAHAAYAYWQEHGRQRFATLSELAAPRDETGHGNLADFIYALHDSLGIPVAGMYLMGIVSLLYGLALISGVLIHLPQLVRDLFALRVGHNLKRLWQDAHNAIGVISLPFHIVFAVTGALLCLFTVTLAVLNTLTFDGKLYTSFAKAVATAPAIQVSGFRATMLSTDALIAHAKDASLSGDVMGFRPDYLHFVHYGDRNAVVEVRGLSQHTLGTYGSVALQARDGMVLETHVRNQRSFNGTVNAAIYGLHFGSFGGRTVQWLYFVLGLAGAFLFYSGNLLWIESRRKRRHLDQPRRTRAMARATIGICIGTLLGISAGFGATRLADYLSYDAAITQAAACYGLFAAACMYAYFRPVPKAITELLLATSLLTLGAAIGDLISNAGVLLHDSAPASMSVLGVDLTGIALGLMYAALARATWRRARFGDPHSVWALAPAG